MPTPNRTIELNQCALALGSNLGDSLVILQAALATLAQTPHITLKTYSSWYKTKAIGPPQPDYLNGCAILNVSITPEALLTIMLDIEQKFGRLRGEPWGARTLDLDLLLFNDLILNSPNLEIPHPRMRERGFVLIPLAEIAPNWVDPVTKKTIKQLLESYLELSQKSSDFVRKIDK